MRRGLLPKNTLREKAYVKVNLNLHITGRRPDGLHALESLVVFPDIADTLTLVPASEFSLHISGPFADLLKKEEESDNLVLRVAHRVFAFLSAQQEAAVGTPPSLSKASFFLEKHIPVASGIGGGSADAAAAVRGMVRLWGCDHEITSFYERFSHLGADIPVCLKSEPTYMQGTGTPSGDGIHFGTRMGIVLVTPPISLLTAEVFSALKKRDNAALPSFPKVFKDTADLVSFLKETRNDLQDAAIALCPVISDILQVLLAFPDVLVARMSGSGATCFGICPSPEVAQRLASEIAMRCPSFWVYGGCLTRTSNGMPDEKSDLIKRK